ncbi:protein O-linked-mannose beta-1,4-N-acetylglucosaminyltransferase 2-like [Hibiscus syriacus]|uniref:Protein O-linked-mannose beta-1,4-N-acetylglucosaminyltransferase 2-like n=1 Tax=Hibiscus syriacus TaxID=106335 RepID=A0A6A3B548_HIBSY|nr:uncharacterized protein LOC120118171 [Hibiscus syriacus]KAE8710189.1 protein O-linked-mannose beta-1,4-N-acetylglucosaminyltransferase 2-like [Hibiscus syriacus]
MGTEVGSKSYLPGFYSMRDLNKDSNCCSWPLYYGDKTLKNDQYYNSFLPKAIADSYPQHDKDRLKRKMLEHEALFQNQVSELHRLYRIQTDLMDEVKNKELQKNQIPIEPSLPSSLLVSQIKTEVAHNWHIPNFSVANSVCGRPSISGVEDAHSPLSSVKGSCIQAGRFLSLNGVNSKDVEMLERRPMKVGRKMFDLQLPADKYMDTEEAEEFQDDTKSDTSSYLPNGNGRIGPESGSKRYHSDVGCQGDASRSDACLRGKNSLANLNEPVRIEETDTSTYSHFVGHDNRSITDIRVGNNELARGFFSCMREAGHSRSISTFISQCFQPQKSVSHQQAHVLFDKAHDPPTFSLTDQSKADHSRERMLHTLDVSRRNCEISGNHNPASNMASNVPSLSLFASSDPVNPWSHSVSSLEKPTSSLNQKSMSVQTRPSFNSSGPYSKSSVLSPHSNGNFGEKWSVSSNSRLNPGFGRESPNRNGFHYGSSSGSKELAMHFLSTNYDYANGSTVGTGVFEQFSAHCSTKPYNCSNDADMKSTNVNLNVVLSNSSSNEPVSLQGPQIDGGRKHEDRLLGLPWVRANPACKNEAIRTGMDLNVGELSFSLSSLRQSTKRDEFGNGFGQIFTQNLKSISPSNSVDASRSEISECLRNKKIHEIPIFEKPYVSKNESSFISPYVSAPQPSEGEAENKQRNRLLDINLPSDATVLDASQDIVAENAAIEKEADKKLSSFRHQIDLNSCADEDEASFIPNVPSIGVRMTGGIIDLEAPLVPEPEDAIHGEELLAKADELTFESAQSQNECQLHELMKSAAEAIVSISSSVQYIHLDDLNCNSSETSTKDPLNWFIETVSSFGEDLESKLEALSGGKDGGREEYSLEEIDYFELIILELAETKEEDYMPKPLVPENFKVEETGTTSLLTTRTRKGQGRQRRDFQREILPGLVSLSRHEVTEDLQTFGGIMRATGRSWQSGSTRRNTNRGACGRGRRRSVTSSPFASAAAATCAPLMQQLHNIKSGLEDRRLTGWGKTTRRPHRQRCPSGNLPSLALT